MGGGSGLFLPHMSLYALVVRRREFQAGLLGAARIFHHHDKFVRQSLIRFPPQGRSKLPHFFLVVLRSRFIAVRVFVPVDN